MEELNNRKIFLLNEISNKEINIKEIKSLFEVCECNVEKFRKEVKEKQRELNNVVDKLTKSKVEREKIKKEEVATDYVLEPNLNDMLVAGYDSYKEYMEGFQFVMLCIEFLCEEKKLTVLVSDGRIKKLLEICI